MRDDSIWIDSRNNTKYKVFVLSRLITESGSEVCNKGVEVTQRY